MQTLTLAASGRYAPLHRAEPVRADIDRQAQRVLAEAAAAVRPAAGKAPEMVDADNPPAKLFYGERLDYLALEIIEPARQPTAHDGRMVKHRLDPADPHRGIDLAARIRRVDRVDGAVADLLGGEPGETGRPAEGRGTGRSAAAREQQNGAAERCEPAGMPHAQPFPLKVRSRCYAKAALGQASRSARPRPSLKKRAGSIN